MARDRRGAGALNTTRPLAGRRILATGASGEIGRVLARRLSELGAALVLVARDASRLDALRSELGGEPHETMALDVRDPEAWRQAAPRLNEIGPLHGLVCAAATIGPIGPIGSYPLDEFRDTMDVNVAGTLRAIESCLDGLVSAGGAIVTFSGGGATSPLPRYTAYATSKAAVVRMTENLAVELGDRGVRINAVAPGFIAGDMHQATLRAGPALAGEAYYARTISALNSGGDPPDRAAELTAFLLSDASAGISGKLLSAIWDPWDTVEFQQRLRNEPDLATLRRIDDQAFTARPAPDR